MYSTINFKTKKALKQAIANGVKVGVYQPGPFGQSTPNENEGTVCLQGPHYPKPHTWYAQATVVNGIVTNVT